MALETSTEVKKHLFEQVPTKYLHCKLNNIGIFPYIIQVLVAMDMCPSPSTYLALVGFLSGWIISTVYLYSLTTPNYCLQEAKN